MNQSFETSQRPITPSIVDTSSISTKGSGMFSGKNLIIIVLTALLILSFLGINLLASLGNLVETISNIFGPLFIQILSIFGYTAGTVIDKSTDVVTDVAKSGIDLAGDTIQSAADLLKNASRDNVNQDAINQMDSNNSNNSNNSNTNNIDKTINESKPKNNVPEPDNSVDPIQKPITAGKTNWCLVGEYQGKRGCIEVNDNSKCMSGQVFPSQKMCINPTRTIISHTHVM
jgi:hypothetical protein